MLTTVIMIVIILLGISVTSSKSTSIQASTKGTFVCPGEELILTCTGIGTTQRWNVMKKNALSVEQIFRSQDQLGMQIMKDVFEFTLISTLYSHFESMLSAVVTNALNNTAVVCTDHTIPAAVTVKIADQLSPPQDVRVSKVEHHSNDSTIVVIWKPANNDSRVDFYQYQLIDNLTEVRVSNTTNTTAVLSGVPYNVNLSFVISAHNCRGESKQATLFINIVEPLNSTIEFDQVTSHIILSSTLQETSTSVVAVTVTLLEKKTDLLLISTSVASTAIIIVLLIVCAIVAAVFVVQLQRKRCNIISHDIELYTEVENAIPIYETIDKPDKVVNCSEFISEADMSYVDMCGGVSPDPVYDSAEVKLEAANDVCKVDETLSSTECCDLSNNGTHYQNIQKDKYSHYSNLPQCQQPTGRSIYDD